MFTAVSVYLHHLKLCVVCINGQRYVCCGEWYVLSPPPALCNILLRTVV